MIQKSIGRYKYSAIITLYIISQRAEIKLIRDAAGRGHDFWVSRDLKIHQMPIFSSKISFAFAMSLNKQLYSISGTNKHRKRHLT